MAKLFLTVNYGLSDEQIENIYDDYNPMELYELLGAVLDTVYELGAKKQPTAFKGIQDKESERELIKLDDVEEYSYEELPKGN